MTKDQRTRASAQNSLISRRRLLATSGLALGAGIASLHARHAALAQGKVTKEAAEYQDTPRDGEQCSDCRFFLADRNACQLVEGDISPTGWCNRFQR